MDIPGKVKKWIEEGKDPRSAHWQGGLESLLEVFLPYLETGRLIPVAPLEEEDIPVFTDALKYVDLSPNTHAAFLPPSIAVNIVPPESAPELYRIEQGKSSYKILIQRPGEEKRIGVVEISEHAEKPGVDLFQSGALLGTYDYENRSDCLEALPLVIKAHLWEKGKWSSDDYRRYTVNWFERVVDVNEAVPVQEDFSYFHTPTLIKSDRVDAMFTLIYETFLRRAQDPSGRTRENMEIIKATADPEARKVQVNEFAEKMVLQFLAVIRDLELVDFKSFSKKENEQFNREYARAFKKIADRMSSGE